MSHCLGCGSQELEKVRLHAMSSVHKVIGVMSGKGGVGKTLVTALLACAVNALGQKVAVLDADIAASGIARVFKLAGSPFSSELGLHPAVSKKGIQLMSWDLLSEGERDPVIWQGPRVAGLVLQFWSQVIWDNVDYLFIDMPPGTGDVPAAVFQSLPIDGVIAVTTPSKMVSETVKKTLHSLRNMRIPILGVVENCVDLSCKSETLPETEFSVLARMPIEPILSDACDGGDVEELSGKYLMKAAETIIKSP